MTNVRTVTMVLPLVCLTAANVSAQSRIAVAGGFNFARIDGDNHSYWQPGRASGFSAGLAAIIPTRGSFEFEFRGAYSWIGPETPNHGPASITEWNSDTVRVSKVAFGNHLGLVALGRANLPLMANGLRTYVAAGPAMSWRTSCDIRLRRPWVYSVPKVTPMFPAIRCSTPSAPVRPKSSLSTPLQLEVREVALHRNTQTVDLTEAVHQGSGESARRRAVTVRSGLVYLIG